MENSEKDTAKSEFKINNSQNKINIPSIQEIYNLELVNQEKNIINLNHSEKLNSSLDFSINNCEQKLDKIKNKNHHSRNDIINKEELISNNKTLILKMRVKEKTFLLRIKNMIYIK